MSIWDNITHSRPDYIKNKDNGDIACDSYHKLEEDVRILKELGVSHYRFSLSWTRILPDGKFSSTYTYLDLKIQFNGYNTEQGFTF